MTIYLTIGKTWNINLVPKCAPENSLQHYFWLSRFDLFFDELWAFEWNPPITQNHRSRKDSGTPCSTVGPRFRDTLGEKLSSTKSGCPLSRGQISKVNFLYREKKYCPYIGVPLNLEP
eukprot:sb/3476450/